jgi:hypothetical protein
MDVSSEVQSVGPVDLSDVGKLARNGHMYLPGLGTSAETPQYHFVLCILLYCTNTCVTVIYPIHICKSKESVRE